MEWKNFFSQQNKTFSLIAGPCSIESEEQLDKVASHIKQEGVTFLRGGVYKLRTNPSAFQGLGADAYELVKKIKAKTGLSFVAEVTDPRQMEDLDSFVDMIQVGSRNMYNYSLLKDLGKVAKPVLLKRGFSATIDEWVNAAEYIRAGGNPYVILCERGIRSFDNKTRNVLDLAAVSYLKQNTDFMVFVDPSHATGRRDLVIPMAKAAVVSGADGIMVEVHPEPAKALSDGPQALTFDDYTLLVSEIKSLLKLSQRELIQCL
ncbi:MAG: 3-deoxy-7-phosphoheptulonate synthase [Bdellovibrionales bacterium]|nr:3-deoxy-7-phosphoheptulonate synthase [Bdellovibrionales bacterium]